MNIVQEAYARLLASALNNGVQAYWWSDEKNFGDLITPFLLKKYGFTPLNAGNSDAELVSTGSVLQQLGEGYQGVILGSGLIEEKYMRFSDAKILAVRGKHTRACLGLGDDVSLGDPGILMERFVKGAIKKYKVGIIPHYADASEPAIDLLMNYFSDSVQLISVRQNPYMVARKVSECDFIFSSSLHGIILAHSYGIRACWCKFGDNVAGGGFKFFDYASSIDYNIVPYSAPELKDPKKVMFEIDMPDPDSVEKCKDGLDRLFRNLKTDLNRSKF